MTTAAVRFARKKRISYTEAGNTLNGWLTLPEDPFIAAYQGRPLEKPDMENLRLDLGRDGLDVWIGKLLKAYEDGLSAEELGFAKAKEYTITFDSAGGSAVAPITQAFGSKVTAPAAPTRSGYTFNGWNPAVPATMPLNGASLTAQWTVNTYPHGRRRRQHQPQHVPDGKPRQHHHLHRNPEYRLRHFFGNGLRRDIKRHTYTTGAITGACTVAAAFILDLAAPVLAGEGGNGEAALSWGAVAGADAYVLYYGTDPDIDPDTFLSYAQRVEVGNVTSYWVTGLINGTDYYFVLRPALSGKEATVKSNEVSVKPAALHTGSLPLNDTGIDWWANENTNYITAPLTSHPGQDTKARAGTLQKVGAGAKGFDFTKLGADGQPLAVQNGTWSDSGNENAGTKWSCVKDNRTGLIWEVKVNDPVHLRHRGHTYTWYNPDSATSGGDAGTRNDGSCGAGNTCDTQGFVEAVNAAGFCGASDWRMPRAAELQSIVDYGRYNPAIDTDFFPNTQSSIFWSSSPYAYSAGGTWSLGFDYGFVGNFYGEGYGKSNSFQARLVRGGQ